jgi:DNA primase
MAKAPADTIKYNIYADITIDGVVEKPDVVGAIFGQSEGLLGEELELRELQKTGRIGRIEVDIKTKVGKSAGSVVIPSSLDMVETSIIAAAVETVDRVGPCNAKIIIKDIEDARSSKRKHIVDRAKELLKKLVDEEIPESDKLTDEVKKSVQLSGITSYQGLPAGPGVDAAESVILVEGRADVLNLLKCGIKNVVAVGGTNIPKQIIDLSKGKTTISFLDGDRGGGIILKELSQIADVDFVARAPKGKEVEELSKKEIIMALRRKIPLSQVRGYEESVVGVETPRTGIEETGGDNKKLLGLLSDVKGKLTAKLYDEKLELITEIEIKDLVDSLKDVQPYCVVFDGIVTQRLVDAAAESKVVYVVGINKSAISDTKKVKILTEKD